MRLIPKQEYLEKTALDPRLLIAGGAALGGLGGYAASDNHPVLGTLGGAALGAGAGAAGAYKLMQRGAGRMLPAHPAPMRVNASVSYPERWHVPTTHPGGLPGRPDLDALPPGRPDLDALPPGRPDLDALPPGRPDLDALPPGPKPIPALAGRKPLKALPERTATEAQYVDLQRPAPRVWDEEMANIPRPPEGLLNPAYGQAVAELNWRRMHSR